MHNKQAEFLTKKIESLRLELEGMRFDLDIARRSRKRWMYFGYWMIALQTFTFIFTTVIRLGVTT